MERNSARSACGVVTLRSADCQVEDKAGKIITSWQKSVIRKERPRLRWLSTPPPAMYPSPFGWCSLEISTEQPLLELSLYKETREDKKWTACSDWSSPVLREAQPAAHSGAQGPLGPWDTPSKPVPCSGVLCCFRNNGGHLLMLPPLPSPIIAAKKQTPKPLAKTFQLWPTATVHFHWQIPCCSLDEVATTFSVIQITFCLISLFTTLLFFQLPSLCQIIAAYREKGLCLLCSIIMYCWFVSSSSDYILVIRSFWLVFITSAFIVNFPWFCLSCPSMSSWYL